MKKTGCSRWGLWGGLFVIALLLIVGFSLFYFQGRAKAFHSRPLVLIHAPMNHDRVGIGDGVLVHATAREDNGLRRIELWADDQLIEARDAPEPVKNLTISSHWNPAQAGGHVLVVRAISSDGVEGQSTVTVGVSDSGEVESQTHTFQEGETPDSIAADHNVSLEDLSASNPDLGSAAPGDELIIPDDGPPAAQEGAAPDASEPPSAEGEAPGSGSSLFANLLFVLDELTPPGEPVALRVEVMELRTDQEFDSLHCYVGLADNSPVWFPDADDNQATDESFAPRSDGEWDVAPYLAGDAAPIISWPENLPLPLNISCVGIAGGGTDALELGRVELSIPPEDWGGPHNVETDGEGGRLFLQYRVIPSEVPPRGIPIWLDPSMTRPTNVRLNWPSRTLRWDYNPDPTRDPPEEPIDGFRIYLNDNLQWVEPPDARETGIPPEWFHPQCGATYTFSVTAFRLGFPDGPESMPESVSVSTPLEGCSHQIRFILGSLETFDLGGDGDPEDLNGDVGPPYGYFFANEWQVNFDIFFPGLNQGHINQPVGLFNNRLYDFSEIVNDPVWRFQGVHYTTVDVPLDGALEFGFHIMDNDWRTDDLICEATSSPYVDGAFDRWVDGTLPSEDGRCRLHYSFGPAFGSPVGSGVAGWEPLPWIDVEDIWVNEYTGAGRVSIRNNGTAAWQSKDLDVQLLTRDGRVITTLTWEDFVLQVEQGIFLDFPAGTVTSSSSPYFEACVFIDPEDKVLELYERDDRAEHGPVCPALPDLIISNVQFDPSDESGTLELTVQNIGRGALRSRTLCFGIFSDGSSLMEPHCRQSISLEPGQSGFFTLIVDDDIRIQMQDGCYVGVNPFLSFLEADGSNNSYDVPAE